MSKIKIIDINNCDDNNDIIFNKICSAGVDLVNCLIDILDKNNLQQQHAGPIISVAAAGIAKGSEISNDEMLNMINSISHLWEKEKAGIRFNHDTTTSINSEKNEFKN